MAAERFKLRDAIPAIQAAADGSVPPDKFVNRFIINGNVLELRGLAKLLKQHAPGSYQQARAQIGEELRRASTGENITGDKIFSPERFNKRLRQIGTAKLEAFFSPAEIAEMRTIGRVGAYMETPPSGSAVNNSSSASGVANWALEMSPKIVQKAVGAARWASRHIDSSVSKKKVDHRYWWSVQFSTHFWWWYNPLPKHQLQILKLPITQLLTSIDP